MRNSEVQLTEAIGDVAAKIDAKKEFGFRY